MEWKESEHIKDSNYNLSGDWLKVEYFEAVNILFRIENSLRVFVYVILKNEYKEKWKDLNVTSDDVESSTIGAIAKKRLMQDKNYAYLGYVINSPLLYLTSGELIRIITSDSYWKLFKEYFLGSKEIIKNKLDEISNVRNSLAHFRPIKKGDIDLVKQNSIHTLSEIEKTIIDLINCSDTVPTNTKEPWYEELMALGNETAKISFKQSKDEKWIKLFMSFSFPILSIKENWIGNYSLETANIRTDNVLLGFQDITNISIFSSEYIPFNNSKDPQSLNIGKKIMFTFSKDCIKNKYGIIKSELEKILAQVLQELDLIKKDNLARGELIEVINCMLSNFKDANDESYYSLNHNSYNAFITQINEKTPVEFWGRINYASLNYITNTNEYPWIPVEISIDNGLPF